MLQALGTIALRLTALGSVTFVVLFAVLAPWRRTVIGRHMMAYGSVVSAILVYVTLAMYLGPLGTTTRAVIRLSVYVALGSVLWWQVGLLVDAQLDNIRRRRVAAHALATRSGSVFPTRTVGNSMNRYAKAIVGALVSGATAWGTAIADGSVTAAEWSGVVVAFLLALGLVWGVPNEPGAQPATVNAPGRTGA